MRSWMWLPVLTLGCDGDKVTSDQEAELAWLGLEIAVDKALTLGLIGFSEASSANIDPQSDAGDESGTITITGQVDQGSSDNKGLRLDIALDDYSDFVDLDGDEEEELYVVYESNPEAPPFADLKLRDVPAGTLEGTLQGDVAMDGDLDGVVTLSLTISGPIESDGASGVQLVDGQTHVTGTATNTGGGEYEIDVTN